LDDFTSIDHFRDATEMITRQGKKMETKRQKLRYSSALKCGWSAWRVLDDGELALDMQPDGCCDMSGAIRVAQAIMPAVFRIVTFAGDVQDTEYRLWQGKWSAYAPQPPNAPNSADAKRSAGMKG
jgi:hypothetical protein